ncbi:MAG: hypothetical protein ACI4R8_04520 [Candidatus Caccovivens sp.]
MKIWSDKEVKSLFESVESCKDDGKSLKIAFELHAKTFKRKPNSVRNYYYKEVDNLKEDAERCKRLRIDLDKHIKNHFMVFGQEEADLLHQIDVLTKQGFSVRSACQKLSGGDLALMTRLQNKYQNEKKKQTGQVIPFRARQKSLTENEINSLFLGLVKLIKKTAVEDIMEKTKLEKESSAFLLKKAFVDLGRKDKQIAELQENFKLLKSENEKLVAKLEESGKNKNQALKAHFKQKRYAETLEN